MKVQFSGSVHYANGDPVSNVVVHIYDKDASGKKDDELTVTPGLSDEHGHFSLTYEPLRFLDYHTIQFTDTPTEPFNEPTSGSGVRLPDLGDIYLPYVKFNYNFNGLIREHTASLGIFQTEFRLPENPPVEFIPSIHGYKFPNSFPGYFIPFSPPSFLKLKKVTSVYGLCGGMCASAYDFLLAGRAIPHNVKVPRRGTRLHRLLFRRQMDSLGGLGQQVVKVAQWTSMPDDTLFGTEALTAVEFTKVRQKLDDKNPITLALIYERASSIGELSRLIFDNHQVLAYGYQQDMAGVSSIRVYDPNLPGRDDVVIRCEPFVLGEVATDTDPQVVRGLQSTQLVGGTFYRKVRGFFAMPYEFVLPPKKI